jgi:hypothetical protein
MQRFLALTQQVINRLPTPIMVEILQNGKSSAIH